MKICIFSAMDEKIIEEIVRKVFDKAKKEHASHSRFALSNHVGDHSDLSSKTLERAYDRYINNKQKYGVPQAESIDLFCKYLGYEDFGDYTKRKPESSVVEEPPIRGSSKKKSMLAISIVVGLILLIFSTQNWFPFTTNINSIEVNCMTWADSLYVEVPCTTGPFSEYGTMVEPIDKMRLKNLKQTKVSQAYPFFTEYGKPLIWYLKNKDGGIEYFTAPGLHPINGETLRKITPYIIQTYVPLHSTKEDSFIN